MEKVQYEIDLSNYIKESKVELISILSMTGFSSDVNLVTECIGDINAEELKNKYMAIRSNIKEHCKNAVKSRKRGSKHELPDPIPKCFLGHPDMAVTIDRSTMLSLLHGAYTKENLPPEAVTPDDYFANFSPEERKILYKYRVDNCVKIATPPELVLEEITPTNSSDEPLSREEEEHIHIEQLKKERDLKRRRQAYRRKVSTKNKSQTEITNEIIANMMEALGYVTNVTKELEIETSNNNEMGAIEKLNNVWTTSAEGFDRYRFCKSDTKDKYSEMDKMPTDYQGKKHEYESKSREKFKKQSFSYKSKKYNHSDSYSKDRHNVSYSGKDNHKDSRPTKYCHRDSYSTKHSYNGSYTNKHSRSDSYSR